MPLPAAGGCGGWRQLAAGSHGGSSPAQSALRETAWPCRATTSRGGMSGQCFSRTRTPRLRGDGSHVHERAAARRRVHAMHASRWRLRVQAAFRVCGAGAGVLAGMIGAPCCHGHMLEGPCCWFALVPPSPHLVSCRRTAMLFEACCVPQQDWQSQVEVQAPLAVAAGCVDDLQTVSKGNVPTTGVV